MKKKLLLASTLIASQLFAESINFDMMEKNPTRVAPNSANQILSFNNSIKKSMNSIVNISAKRHVDASTQNLPLQMFNDPFFKRFFGDQFGNQFKQNRVQRSLGSGVIVSKNGYIVTNNHVIENAEEISVTIGTDTTEYNAKLIGRDSDSDIAVIKIEAKNLSPIKLGHSKSLKIADMIFAIGNPFGIGSTVTQGIISALNKNKVGINRYENYIQTDASINPGNSGGALVDSRGALIGINTAIISKSGGNNGIGFAIPVDMVRDVVKKLVSDGKVTRGYLGVSISDLDQSLEKVYNHKKGALVLDVSPDSPASKYGLKRGDLIYTINSKKITDRTSLQNVVASFKPNQKVAIEVERDKKNIKLDIVLGNRDSLVHVQSNNGRVLGGLKLAAIDVNMKKQFRLTPDASGILISDVAPKSKAEKTGFQSGDIIIQIEDIEIKNFANIETALTKYNNKHKRVYVNRYGQTILFVTK
ncbi:Do family serine endopeptidase [Poseidonibacter lekithochrous]|uniref:Do family serine endopeptidase n=1 Tax=Poseidonibacter lekithochrous TaxID=1904463 RepID=UPI0008FCCF84|nr:Do family serine endopeptidase [Poseidonibacter lekithochrous]QKJ24420.1 periplasmic heat shock serine protease HtrA, Do family [Poseidonibacter lekithochrous]